jgi:hypothetical protein
LSLNECNGDFSPTDWSLGGSGQPIRVFRASMSPEDIRIALTTLDTKVKE